MFEIVLYQKKDGTIPVDDFINTLDIKMKAKVLRVIKCLEENGYELREPYSKSIRNGIFELRAKSGSDISRVLYFFVIGNKAVLTNGFIKKSMKTPNSEIERAERYRRDYLSREENEQ